MATVLNYRGIAMHHRGHNKGFSLIELVIAMLIGVFLMLGATSLFISNKRIYKEQEAMGRLQENSRFAMQMLISDIRSAGFSGCAHDHSRVENLIIPPPPPPADADPYEYQKLLTYTATNIIEGGGRYEDWLPSYTGSLFSVDAIGDAITIRGFRPLGINPSGPTTGNLIPTASTPSGIVANDALVIYDCDSAHIFRATGTGSGGIRHAHPELAGIYDTDAEVGIFHAVRYAIHERTDADGDGTLDPALWREDATSLGVNSESTREVELIQGVELMRIRYGEDRDDDGIPDAFTALYNVTNWQNVIAVKLAVLFRTISPNPGIEPDTRVFRLLDISFGPAMDKHRRQQVDATISIRNRTSN